jgi:hypothetical protein
MLSHETDLVLVVRAVLWDAIPSENRTPQPQPTPSRSAQRNAALQMLRATAATSSERPRPSQAGATPAYFFNQLKLVHAHSIAPAIPRECTTIVRRHSLPCRTARECHPPLAVATSKHVPTRHPEGRLAFPFLVGEGADGRNAGSCLRLHDPTRLATGNILNRSANQGKMWCSSSAALTC